MVFFEVMRSVVKYVNGLGYYIALKSITRLYTKFG